MAHKNDREKGEGRENARSHSGFKGFFVCFLFVFRLSDGLFVSLFRGWGLAGGRGGAVKFNGVEGVKAECVRVSNVFKVYIITQSVPRPQTREKRQRY